MELSFNKLLTLVVAVLFSQWSMAQVDGKFEEHYDNGTLKKQGSYKDEKPNGTWKEYHPNGQLSSVYSYTDGKLDKERVSYFENGLIRSETNRVGEVYLIKRYYESGNLHVERLLNSGFYKEFRENGVLLIESFYKDGELSGVWKRFHDSGNLEWIVDYEDGYREGIYQHYDNDGHLRVEGKMLKNKKHGEEKRYFENGMPEWIGNYKSDKFDKYWQHFDSSGKLVHKIKFKNGVKTSIDDSQELQDTEVPDGLIERMPIYPGCEDLISNKEWRKCLYSSIRQFIASNFNVNHPATRDLEGRQRIVVKFKIGTDGKVREISAKAKNPVLELEALRVVSLLPKIQPGQQRGKPVVVPFTQPISFIIPGNDPSIRKNN